MRRRRNTGIPPINVLDDQYPANAAIFGCTDSAIGEHSSGSRDGLPTLYLRFMDFELSDEQRAFAETARAFAREEWLPQAPGWDERGEFPVAALRRAAELGFAGIYVGDEFGGSGLGRIDATIIFEELAAACVSTAAFLIDPQHGGVDDRPLRQSRAARAVSAAS